jgi:hypothetical protein
MEEEMLVPVVLGQLSWVFEKKLFGDKRSPVVD